MMNSIIAREDFNQAVVTFADAFGITPQKVVTEFKLTQAELRLEQLLAANTNQYTFPIMNNIPSATTPGGIFNTETRLAAQDTFVPTHVGFFICLPASSADTTFRLYSYPNQFVFANALQYRALWNSKLEISVQQYRYVYNWGMQRHWVSNQTQQTAAFGAASPEDQNNFAVDGFYPMQPFVLFGGSQAVDVKLLLAAAPTAVDANSRVIMMFRGVQAQQSTPVN